ncbi:MAG: gliding motility-associated C-terminal domain-containing protein [Bacteroidetes bacterium]|nr:gliding motility-associated C-terminal domain-containing protein [Bacteroidota bacterium]
MHEWAKSFTAKQNSANSHNTVWGLDIDSNDNSYVVGICRDSFFIDTFKIGVGSQLHHNFGFTAKVNTDGEVQWVRTLYTKRMVAKGDAISLHLSNIRVLTSNRIVVYGRVYNASNSDSVAVLLSPNDSLVSGAGTDMIFIAEYDSLGRLTYYQKIVNAYSAGALNFTGLLEKDKDNNVMLALVMREGTIYTRNAGTSFSENFMTSLLLKYSPNFDSLIWVKQPVTSQTSNSQPFHILKIRADLHGNLYVVSKFSESTREINGVTYSTNLPNNGTAKGFLMVYDSVGNVLFADFLHNKLKQQDNIADIIAIDTGNIYMVGYVEDTLIRNGVSYYVTKGLPPDIPQPNSTTVFPYVIKMSLSQVDWVRMPQKKISLSSTFSRNIYSDVIRTDFRGNIYTKFEYGYNNNIAIGELADTLIAQSQSRIAMFVKFDTLGNALWLKSGVAATDMSPNSRSELVYCGSYNGQLELDPFILNSHNSQRTSGFLAKITDYSITRGEVLSGPYCAGDTFLVPYSKMGNYDTANYFIAELSDENGNFEGGERELGRIKSTEDSTITGRLPLFQVASSGNYRIRVRSTHPPVQSFYKLDSLRLLIYSRDKADPGGAETVCYGDSFQLKTFGGTAWQWTPAYNMDDSTSRTPFIIPDKDTVYRIVISDSSGCGEADTAYKRIYVRPHPRIITDSLINICLREEINLIASFTQGDTSGFRWTWYNTNDLSSWQELKTDSFALTDTILFTFPDTSAITHFALVLEDGCSTLQDTAYIVARPTSPLLADITDSLDNILSEVKGCSGQTLTFVAKGTGGLPSVYTYSWTGTPDLTLSNSDSAVVSVQLFNPGTSDNVQQLRLVMTDGCMPSDTADITLRIRPKLSVQMFDQDYAPANDTSVCSGSELKFFAKGIGGVEEDYEFTWLLDNEEISKGDSVEINSKDFKNPDAILTLILSDDCSVLADTQKINLHTLPELKAEFSAPDTICLGEEISLTAQGFGGVENQYQFTWLHKKDDESLEVLKNADTLDLNSKALISESQYSQFNTREIFLVLRDNCSSPNDTFSRKIIIRPELSLTLSSSTICADPNATLTANPKGGNPNSYSINWFDKNGNPLGNGLTQTVSPEGFDKFSATLSDNCSSESATAEIKVDRVPELLTLENTPSEGCEPLPVDFTLQTNYPDKYGFTLSFGNGDSTHTFEIPPTLHYTYPHAGHFIPLLTLITAGGCQAQVSGQAIEVYPKPFADFGYQPEEPDMDNPLVSFQNRSTGAVSYQWDIAPFGTFTDENPIVTYSDTGYHNVRLIAVSSHGCRDTSDSRLYIKTNYRVFFPSAFSPNGDGLNDTFKPLVRGFSELDFKVYSRWGELLFHSRSDEAWDGSSQGVQVPNGVYAFTLRVVNVFGETQFFTGTVTVVR